MKDKKQDFELSYLTKQMCVIVKVSRETFRDLDSLGLEALMKRVQKKLESEKSAGRIQNYIVSPDLLERVWPALKKLVSDSDNHEQYAIRFAFGVKNFEQVTVSSPESEGAYCEISIDASSDEIRTWNIVALSTYIKDVVHRNKWAAGSPDKQSLKAACKFAEEHRGERVRLVQSSESDELEEIIKVHSKSASSAVAQQPTRQSSHNADANSLNYPGKGLLKITVDPDAKSARVILFDTRWYQNPSLVFDAKWLGREVERLGIASAASKDLLERVNQKLIRQQALNGLELAHGIDGTPGVGPYLAPCVDLTASKETRPIPKSNVISCRKGAIVAEIRYRTPASEGRDIYGRPLAPPPGEVPEIELGEGVEKASSLQFRATQDGLLKVEGFKVSVLKTYICEGDVNANSGAINFHGSMIITGDIEEGASVSATGDITVEGSIRGGAVTCRGNLTVKGGIRSTDKATVRCDGDLKAGFIEQATVYCKGKIFVETAILQSAVYCGGDIELTGSDSRVGASSIFAWGSLTSAKLGFATGAPTLVHLGEDWKEARRKNILEARLQRMNDSLHKAKNELQTLRRLRKGQMTKAKLELQETLERAQPRLELISQALENRLAALSETRTRNPQAKLKLSYPSEGDSQVTIAGEPFKTAALAA